MFLKKLKLFKCSLKKLKNFKKQIILLLSKMLMLVIARIVYLGGVNRSPVCINRPHPIFNYVVLCFVLTLLRHLKHSVFSVFQEISETH